MLDTAPRVVAWLAEGDEVYGVAENMISIATAVARRGWRVAMICLEDGLFAERCRRMGMQVISVGTGRPPRMRGGTLQKAAAFFGQIVFWWRETVALAAQLGRLQPDALVSTCNNN
jgi:UDP-N-acetylglucosamine:LPS N-acetylglucosamine transferase